MFDAAFAAYGTSELLRQRIAIRRKVIPFLDLQYYAENEDAAKVEETVGVIRANLLA